jgi:hypothetical protein
VAGRCRPNTLRAVAFDLKVFFSVTGKDPVEVAAADVFEFLTGQRGDRAVVRLADRESGLSARTIARRLSSVSGLYAYLVARGDTPVRVNPVPRGLMTRRAGGSRRSRTAPSWQTAASNGWSTPWISEGSQGGGFGAAAPGIGRNGDGRLELFAVGRDGNLYHKWQTVASNGWTDWAQIPPITLSRYLTPLPQLRRS